MGFTNTMHSAFVVERRRIDEARQVARELADQAVPWNAKMLGIEIVDARVFPSPGAYVELQIIVADESTDEDCVFLMGEIARFQHELLKITIYRASQDPRTADLKELGEALAELEQGKP